MRVAQSQASAEAEDAETDGFSLRIDRPVVETPIGHNVGPARVVRPSKLSGEVVERV